MKNSLIGALGSVLGSALLVQTAAIAGDISVFGGRLQDGDGQNSVAISVGFDVPRGLSLFTPSELRADLGYLFSSIDVPLSFIGDDGNAETILNTDFGTVTAHAGPAWRLGLLNRVSVFAGAQLGVAFQRADSEFIGPIPPAVDIFDEITQTSFSYQLPVGFEYSFTDRIGVTSRYRLLGVTAGGGSVDHILEGGVIIKF